MNNIFGVHEQALSLRARRTELLATNLANADTPGYKARDLDFNEALKSASQSNPALMSSTHAMHMKGSNTDMNGVSLVYRSVVQPSIDGNTVDSQLEKAKFTENALRYQASVTFLDSKIKGLLRAIRGE
jgi:flagellar basal-body rod protein FlgB